MTSEADPMDPIWWVASYPKSGNTWVRMLLFSYCLKTNITAHLTRYDDLNPYFYQSVCPVPLTELNQFQVAAYRGAVLQHMRAQEEGPMAVKTHFPVGEMADIPWFSPLWTHKAVHVIRDPRAVLPSMADHLGQDHEYTVEFMNTRDAAVQKDCGLAHLLSTWSHHVGSWINSDFDTLNVRYRDLHDDAEEQLARILDFLGIEVVEDVVEATVEEVQFDNLQRHEEQHGFSEASQKQDQFFRRGEVESWRDEVDPKHVRQIEEDHGDVMERLGFKREYESQMVVAE